MFKLCLCWNKFQDCSFLLLEILHCVVHPSLSIHSPTDEHLACLHFLAIANNAVMTICRQVFLWTYVFMELLRNMVKLCMTLEGTTRLSSKLAVFTFPPAMHKGESTGFSTSPPLAVLSHFYSHFCGCEAVSQCSFKLHFPSD